MQELEKHPGRRDEILPLHTGQGTFSSRVAGSSCLSANAIRFKSPNYHPGNSQELFWRYKTRQGQEFSSRFGPAPCREEPLVLRTIPGVQHSHSGLRARSLGFTLLEDIPAIPRDTQAPVALENKMINGVSPEFFSTEQVCVTS